MFSMPGSEPAPPSGSVIRNAERTAPAASGAQEALLLRGRRHLSSRCMLPSSGAMQFIATGPEHRVAAGAEHGRGLAVREAVAAEVFG